jgi:lipoyl(octanoyl) transferase
MSERLTKFIHLGTKDYLSSWDFQEKLFQQTVKQKIANRTASLPDQITTTNYLIFVYHPHVYTLGKSGDSENLLLDALGLKKINAEYHKVNRGGDITYHGLGQLVGYPILDLDHFFTDIHKYLRYLEEAIIRTCADFGLDAGRIEGLTGVWIDAELPEKARKICAMGVKSSRWVTMHGFAFNINTDLSYFNHIIPCGIDDKAVTSLQAEKGEVIDEKLVESSVKRHLADLFKMIIIE